MLRFPRGTYRITETIELIKTLQLVVQGVLIRQAPLGRG